MVETSRVVLVTGATSGVGRSAATVLYSGGWTVLVHARDEERGRAVMAELTDGAAPGRGAGHGRGGAGQAGGGTAHLVTGDFSRLDDVRALARDVSARWPRLDALVNNAGLAGETRVMTPDGFERTLQVNHLAPFLLTHLLMPALHAAGGRVVNVSSKGHRGGKLDRRPVEEILRGAGSYNGLRAYADSKLANVLFTRELARRENAAGSTVTTNALHPGVLATGIWNRNRSPLWFLMRLLKPFMGSSDRGGTAVARLVRDPALAAVTGRYFDELEETEPSLPSEPDVLAAELWRASTEAVGLEPPPTG